MAPTLYNDSVSARRARHNPRTNTATTATQALISLGYQGLTQDAESGLIHARYRDLNPPLGRWMQGDSNQTAMILVNGLLQQGQAAAVSPNVIAFGQQVDGSHIYQFVRGNPITGLDPTGTEFTLPSITARAAIGGALFGAADLSLRRFALGQKLSAGQIIGTLALDAGLGFGGSFLLARLANGLAARAGIGAVEAAAAVGLIFAPAIGGPFVASGIGDFRDATTPGESLYAGFEIATGVTTILAPHLLLNRSISFRLKLKMAARKVPKPWGPGRPADSGSGRQWVDPKNPNNSIRVDDGNLGSKYLNSQKDHVHIRVKAKVIGRGGAQEPSGKTSNAHIPLDEWLQWARWDSP